MTRATTSPEPVTPRAFSCRCGRPIFFRNSRCLACERALGYDAERRQLHAIEPVADEEGLWQESGVEGGPRWRRCVNLDTASGCNWLIDAAAPPDAEDAPVRGQCTACRLTRTLPDLSLAENAERWQRIAMAQRRLVSTLVALALPVRSWYDDPERGLAFDLLRAVPGAAAVTTGHVDGVITIDVEEADDATREQRRQALHEPYRTLLGHLRHECGHYYWMRLVEHGPWLAPFRERFGDERTDYAAALQAHYEQGAPADWGTRFVSAYASAHPWEDWAETWAHYLHLVDTLDTARSFGLHGERVELNYERFDTRLLADADDDADAQRFIALLGDWMELTGVLNELSRSMGLPDFYPFVLSYEAVRKLHFVHRVVSEKRR
jgi:hypothetical protein